MTAIYQGSIVIIQQAIDSNAITVFCNPQVTTAECGMFYVMPLTWHYNAIIRKLHNTFASVKVRSLSIGNTK